ncbi:ABC transporter permease [Demequina sp.]|uniref:ABC transporter permease n=1 Tax=Demequina sp. TaxID=2050685 RepID=UPI0025BBF45F|nr:ABC transporter permease [Demequina sp.]
MTNERSLLIEPTHDDAGHEVGPTASPLPTPWRRVAVTGLLVAAFASIALVGFAWPAAHSAPRDVPVAVVAPPTAVDSLQQSVEMRRPGAFELAAVGTRAEATRSLENGEVAGVIMLGPEGVEVLVASAASPMLAQVVTGLADALAGERAAQAGIEGPSAAVTDLAPTSQDDPRGAGLASAILPLSFGGVVLGGLALFSIAGMMRQLALVLVTPVVTGAAVVGIVHGWLGSLSGNVLAEWGTMALAMTGIATAVLGLGILVGRAGFSVVAVSVMLLGNPLAGIAGGPQTVPPGWAELGQALPPGALLRALRSLSAFDGAGSGAAYLALTIWLVSGLGLLAIAASRRP